MTAEESRKMTRSQMAWRNYFERIILVYMNQKTKMILYHDIERTKYYKRLDNEEKKDFFNDCSERIDEALGRH